MIILHISDIHIKTGNEEILCKSDEIASCTYEYLPYIQYVFIVISGDISFSGQKDQFVYAEMFIDDIKKKILEENNDVNVKFIIVPGNHDCDFDKDSDTRKKIIETITKSDDLSEDIIDTCSTIQKNYFDFYKLLTGKDLIGKEKLIHTESFDIDNYQINFTIMNSALLSKKNEEYGKLLSNNPSQNIVNTNNIHILVLHHPLYWFQNHRELRAQIKSNLIISAHEHINNYGTIQDTEHDNNIQFIESGALSTQEKLKNSSFNIIHINLHNISESHYYEYNYINDSYTMHKEKQITLVLKQSHQLPIKIDFQQVLQEPGASYKQSINNKLHLSDFFIFPELEKIIDKNNDVEIVSSENLKDVKQGIIALIGEEKYGKTSLLHILFMYYHEIGFIPLLLDGYSFANNKNNIKNLITNAVKQQYGDEHVEKYNKISKHKKILLIDNFNKSDKKKDYNSIISELNKLSDCIIITLENTFETDFFNNDITTYYYIKSFGYHLRRKLIEKWVCLDSNVNISDDEMLYKCDEIAKILNQAINMTIPSVPFYLIILIESIFAGDTRQLLDSGLKPYYDYLIAESLQKNGITAHELHGIKHYLQLFAGKLFELKKDCLSEKELNSFNDDYAQSYHELNFKKRIDVLINAKIIIKQNDEYKFYYKYLHYYFITEYFTEHLDDEKIKDYICLCCKHLYVKDYANTILFLTNVKYDSFILSQLMTSLANVFNDVLPITFQGDTKEIQNLFNEAPTQIAFDDTMSPEENRQISDKELDKSNIEIYYDKQKNDDELTELENMIIIITNMNIISRILKTNYETIKKEQKIDILTEYYNAPLRAIQVYYNNLIDFKDEIITSIEQKFANATHKKDKLTNLVVNHLRFLTDITTFLYLFHAANGLSHHLNQQINVISRKSPAHELISFLHELKKPGDIPIAELNDIINKFKKEPLALRVIRMGVLQRLHMFTTTSSERQKLSQIENLNISIQTQRIIEYKTNKHR